VAVTAAVAVVFTDNNTYPTLPGSGEEDHSPGDIHEPRPRGGKHEP
jgi:hypothetical protein